MTTGDGLFNLEEALLWTLILAKSNGLKLKCLDDGFFFFTKTHSFSLHMLTDGLESCGLRRFITLILTAPIHCRESIDEKVM